MKTFLTAIIALTGIVGVSTESNARDCESRDHGYHTYYREEPSCRYGYQRDGYESRSYYGRSYYSSEPRYYYSEPRYRPEPRHYRSERCYSERRHSFRPPLFSFLFGF